MAHIPKISVTHLLPAAAYAAAIIRVRFHIIRSARIENVGKSQTCMVSSYADVVVVNVTGILTARLSTDAASANRILSTSADWPYVF